MGCNKKFKFFLIFMIILLIFSACVRNPEEKPLRPEASSMFRKGDIEKVQVLSDNTPIRSGNSENYDIITYANKNSKLDVAGYVGKWYVVILDDGRVGAINPEDVKPVVEKSDVSVENGNIVKLTPNEQEMLRLINAERAKRGLNLLKLDLQLTEVARIKSQDMIDNNYFSHYSPTYGSPFEMMENFGVKYIYAGENIAGNSSVKDAHESLMKSEGHRKNILNPNFTHVGIGIKEGSKYGKVFTQMFIKR